MAEQTGKFLTELPELTTPIEDDLMYIVDDDISKRITLKNLRSVVGGEDVTGTASGAVATFIDGGDDKPMKSLVAEIEATQDLHGYSKPWAGGAGKNKANVTITSGVHSGITLDVSSEGVITTQSVATGNTNIKIGEVYLETGKTYILNGGYSAEFRLYIYIDGTYYTSSTGDSNSFSVTNSGTYDVYITQTPQAEIDSVVYPMIRLSTAPEGFEPYITPEVTTIPLDRTVYGGTLDVTRGILTVNKGFKTYTGEASENWIYTSSLNLVYINIADAFRPTLSIGIISNLLHESLNRQEDYGAYINDQGNLVVYAPSTITSASDWKTWVTSNNIQVVYELATPQTYTLTPEEVSTILGYNNISADSGEVSVVYVRDLNITINDLINRVTALENE